MIQPGPQGRGRHVSLRLDLRMARPGVASGGRRRQPLNNNLVLTTPLCVKASDCPDQGAAATSNASSAWLLSSSVRQWALALDVTTTAAADGQQLARSACRTSPPSTTS